MSKNISDQLVEANNIYQQLHNAAEVIAYAAHEHPEAAYDIGESYMLDPDFKDELTPKQAESDIQVMMPILAGRWQDGQNHMIFELMPETERLDDESELKEAYKGLEQNYQELEEELIEIDNAVDQVIDASIIEENKSEYIFEANTIVAAD